MLKKLITGLVLCLLQASAQAQIINPQTDEPIAKKCYARRSGASYRTAGRSSKG